MRAESESVFKQFFFNVPKRLGLTLRVANVARESPPKPSDNPPCGVL